MSNQENNRVEETNYARNMVRHFNKGESDAQKMAQFGEIEIDLAGFKELR